MEITVGLFLLILLLAFLCEYIDSAMGMGYGTILTPVLLLIGFEPLAVVPAVLLSQAFGGFSASVFHQRFGNVSFRGDSDHLKMVALIAGFGILATILAAFISVSLPKVVVKTYIGILVLVMGVFLLLNRGLVFTWGRMVLVGIVSAFNKGISGGGFGPVVTGGQVLAGQEHKGAIGVTTLAEAPICITGFLAYLIARTMGEFDAPIMEIPFSDFLTRMFSPRLLQWELLLALFLGSILVAPFGALTTRRLNSTAMKYMLGVLMCVLGCWTLIKTWV
jgi:uncharacterized protein